VPAGTLELEFRALRAPAPPPKMGVTMFELEPIDRMSAGRADATDDFRGSARPPRGKPDRPRPGVSARRAKSHASRCARPRGRGRLMRRQWSPMAADTGAA